MRRWRTGFFLILCISCLAGFTYHNDTGKAYGLDKSYYPLFISFAEQITGDPGGLNAGGSLGRFMESILQSYLSSKKEWTPMEALDKVRLIYATNFDKVSVDNNPEDYYYKLEEAEYYLVYEGLVGEKYYLIHLYEFVLDEPETGIGHTVTYGWYTVDPETGEIMEQ